MFVARALRRRPGALRRPWSSHAADAASSPLHPADVAVPLATAAAGGFACLVAADVARADALDVRSRKALEYLGRVGAALLGREENPDTPRWAADWPEPAREWVTEAAVRWEGTAPADRAVYGIIAANVAVWLLRRAPPPTLVPRAWDAVFTHALPPAPASPLTLATSNWAHRGGLHLIVNMTALASLGPRAADEMGAAHFVGAYAAFGLASGALSHAGRAAFASTRGAGGASLGASGCVYGVVAWLASRHPNDPVHVFPLDAPVRLGDAVAVLMAADAIGVAARWRLFDHWGHLGGAVAGVALARAGATPWDAAAAAAARVRAARDAADAWLDERWRSGQTEGKRK